MFTTLLSLRDFTFLTLVEGTWGAFYGSGVVSDEANAIPGTLSPAHKSRRACFPPKDCGTSFLQGRLCVWLAPERACFRLDAAFSSRKPPELLQ